MILQIQVYNECVQEMGAVNLYNVEFVNRVPILFDVK